MKTNKHVFALYAPNLSSSIIKEQEGASVSLHDKDLHKRMFNILRLEEGDQVILFDKNYHVELVLKKVEKQASSPIVGKLISKQTNTAPTPNITLYQCITKKSPFEEIVYTATQMGVQTIVPVISEKSEKKWAPRETERLEKIIIAAIEQSKSFVFPKFAPAQELSQIISDGDLCTRCTNSINIVFDAQGQPASLLPTATPPAYLNVIFGAEGGLTDAELAALTSNGFTSYALTTSILRSRDAAIVGLGMLRSLLRK
ncbi:16S rRNA (uracil(1498)-N(3))-methyltransferase [Candidatus Babeliales bacterium]|nr:16S rRNA (uracil(1498)-N(3))-methyltransferase [Candidatus Babeliales bacterium]